MTGRPARLALNGKWLGQETTGTQRYAAEMTRHLLPRLPDRAVLHVPANASVPEWLAGQVDVRRSRMRGTPFEQVALPWVTRRDLLVSFGGAAPLLARRQVATMHDATPFRLPRTYGRVFGTWYRLMYRVVARRAERLLTVSEFSRRELSTVLAVDADRFVVVPNGVEHSASHRADEPVDVGAGAFVLMVGPPAAHKNIAPVAAALAGRGVRVVVVGRAAHGIFRGADSVGAEENGAHGVRWLGRVSDPQMIWLYRHASALVFPSLYEGFGLPVVEAQQLGCPVVTSDRASLPEVAGDGAVLVDPTDPERVAQRVVELLADDQARTRLAALGRANVERFRWAASADRVAETLSALRGLSRASGRP